MTLGCFGALGLLQAFEVFKNFTGFSSSPPPHISFPARTLEERAQRLFSTKGKSLEALDTSLFAKNPKTKGSKR